MGDRPRDDTTQSPPAPRPARERAPGAYYYDDGTGYEIYNPMDDEEVDADEEQDKKEARDDAATDKDV